MTNHSSSDGQSIEPDREQRSGKGVSCLTSLVSIVGPTILPLIETGTRVILVSIKEGLAHGENEAPSPI